MTKSPIIARGIRRWATCLTLALITVGCSRPTLTGIFVAKYQTEIDTLRLVEAPPGKLSGSFVISALNTDGSRKPDAVYSVTGSVNGPNVALKLSGGLLTLAHWFGAPTNLVGRWQGNVLTLSFGSETEAFQQMSRNAYQTVLANLDLAGQHIAKVQQAKQSVAAAQYAYRQLMSDLERYQKWGQDRINHVARVRQWYQRRVASYSNCLRRIRPLAAHHVPSWHWQGCVLSIENDQLAREQEATAIRHLPKEEQDVVGKLNARIIAVSQEFSKAAASVRAACPYMDGSTGCEKLVVSLTARSAGLPRENGVVKFRASLPKIRRAIDTDTQISIRDGKRLTAIAREVSAVYRAAN